MKLLVKLVIVATLVNAAYRVGSAYITYFTFRDAVHEALLFGPRDEAALRARIVALAEGYDVPLTPEAVSVRRDNRRLHAQGFYDQSIEIVPRYPYPWRFTWSLDVVPSGAAGL